jgi:excisionase family DNA binding protein
MTSIPVHLGEDDVQRIADAVFAKLQSSRIAEASSKASPARLTIAEVADELRCTERHVRRLIARGQLRPAKLGGGSSRVLVARSDVQRLLQESTR